MRAQFSAGVIGELRHRVIHHNGQLRGSSAAPPLIKLGALKGLYKRWYGGADPHQHALDKIDRHLIEMRADLAKAQPPRRDEKGQFSGQRGFYHDVARPADHRRLADENAGYDATQTQIIPETRFSTMGPPIAAGTAIAAVGAFGAVGDVNKPSLVDPAYRWAGKKSGALVGNVSGLAIRGAAKTARGGIGLVNRHAHTTFARPGPTAGQALHVKLQQKGAAWGAEGASRAGRYTDASFLARRGVDFLLPGHGNRILGRSAGALASAATIGLRAAPVVYGLATDLGPWLDSAFPRRVRKMDLELLNAPEVLAKRDELLADDLAKANIGPALQALRAATRALGARAQRVVATLRPSVASHTLGPTAAPSTLSGAAAQANRVFNAAEAKAADAGGQFKVGAQRLGRAITVGRHVAPLAILGAGTGALAGAGGVAAHDHFRADAHPRDQRGRFATKARAAKTGAAIGGAVGLGVGLVAGLAAASKGHGALLAQALGRLGAAVPGMRDATETAARNAHAQAWFDVKANAAKIPKFKLAPSGSATHVQIRESLIAHAQEEFDKTLGASLLGGPTSYYTHQVDEAFDQAAFTGLRRTADANPLLSKATGKPLTGQSRNLINDLDADSLSPDQKKLWGDLTRRRTDAIESVKSVYAQRAATTASIDDRLKELRTEHAQLTKDTNYVPERLQELDQGDARFAEVRRFAKDKLGLDLKSKTKDAALSEIKEHLPHWEARTETRVEELNDEIDRAQTEVKERRTLGTEDLTTAERMAIKDPFATGKKQFFDPMPNPVVARQVAGLAGARGFEQESNRYVTEAQGHLDSLVTANEAALRSRLPGVGLPGRIMARAAPVLSAHLGQGMADAAAISSAHRSAATGIRKIIYDWAHQNSNVNEAYKTAAKISDWAGRQGKRGFAFAVRNAGSISTVTGVAGALGAYDIASPKGKSGWQLNPFEWHRPRELRIERDRPNPIDRPHEIVLGLSHLDRDNQRKYLTGVYVHGKGDADYRELPFGVPVEQVRQQIRNRQGGGGGGNQRIHIEPVKVNDPAALRQAIERLTQANRIDKRMGPADAPFHGLVGNNPAPESNEVVKQLYKDHIEYLERFAGQSTNKPTNYWKSLAEVFEAPGTGILTATQRAHLLVGGGGHKRGIFANRGGVFGAPASADKQAVTNELVRQIGLYAPSTPEEFRQLKRAVFVLGAHYRLEDPQVNRVRNTLEAAYTRTTARPPPNGPESHAAGSRSKVQEVEQAALQIPLEEREPGFEQDEDLLAGVATAYRDRVAYLRRMHQRPDAASPWTEKQIHDEAIDIALGQVRKGETVGELAKFLSWSSPANQTPPIAGAAKQPNGASLATKADATHQLGQAGSYTGGQLGLDAGEALGSFVPGGRIIGGAIGGLTGSVIGGASGAQAGHKLGDTTRVSGSDARTTGEQLARSGAGLVASAAGLHAAKVGQKVGIKALPRALASEVRGAPRALAGKVGAVAGKARSLFSGGAKTAAADVAAAGEKGIAGAATRAATAGTFERLGAKAGEAVGSLGGTVAGEVADPAGGGLLGRIGGKVVGGAIGAGAGWLADEGVGLLYRHLGGYGAHVPAMAAKSLGVHPGVSAKLAAPPSTRA